MFSGGIEFSHREEPHVQLLKGNLFNGYPIDHYGPVAKVSVKHVTENRAHIRLRAFYGRRRFYQVKWWVMLPFSEDVLVDNEAVDVYTNAAADAAGIVYGRHWTRVKLYPVRSSMRVKVGRFTFTIRDGNVKDLMIYRRRDNSLIELEWIWWNEDRQGPIPRRWFYTSAYMDVDGGIPPKTEKPLIARLESRLKRLKYSLWGA